MICFLDPNLEKKVFRSKLPISAKMLKFSDFGSFAVSLLFFRKQGASTNCQNAKFGCFANKTDAIGSRKSSRLCSTRIQPKSELLADWWDRIRYGVGYRVGARPACRMWACTLEKGLISAPRLRLNQKVMHLSMSLPTPPPPGWVGKQWGVDKLTCQYPHPWGINSCQFSCIIQTALTVGSPCHVREKMQALTFSYVVNVATGGSEDQQPVFFLSMPADRHTSLVCYK